MSIEVRHLRQFVTVAEELHFTRAAELLHVAQPALSAQIRRLEEELQVRLFERSTRLVRLTPEGETFFVAAKAAIEKWDDALSVASSLRRGEAGQVSLGVSLRINSRLRTEIQRALVAINPLLTVEFIAESTPRLLEEVAEGRLDAALCLAPARSPGMRRDLVRHDPTYVALPASHRLADRDLISLTELRDEAWILPNRVFGSTAILHERSRAVGFEMRVAAESSADYDDDFTAVVEGHGVEVIPGAIGPARDVEGVVFVQLEDLSIPLEVVYRTDAGGPPRAALIRAIMDSQARATTPERPLDPAESDRRQPD